MRWFVLAVALALASAFTGSAQAGALVGRGVSNPTLKVDAAGMAVVEYTVGSRRKHLLVWGAVNGAAHPPAEQARFKIDYSGGWSSKRNARYWTTIRNACRPYDGPSLIFFVAGCRAADGSYWALQSWQRNLPMRGFDPWTDKQRQFELHVSHWSGPLPELEIYTHWTYDNARQGFFGRLTYLGEPVFGNRSSDPWARNVSIDVFNSDYGPGWRHDTAIAAHRNSGGFCYSFVPQAPPRGYPSSQPNGWGIGELFRVVASGPGVTPIVSWQGPYPGKRYDAKKDAQASPHFDEILGNDQHCARER